MCGVHDYARGRGLQQPDVQGVSSDRVREGSRTSQPQTQVLLQAVCDVCGRCVVCRLVGCTPGWDTVVEQTNCLPLPPYLITMLAM